MLPNRLKRTVSFPFTVKLAYITSTILLYAIFELPIIPCLFPVVYAAKDPVSIRPSSCFFSDDIKSLCERVATQAPIAVL
jgi:hypothetical protein